MRLLRTGTLVATIFVLVAGAASAGEVHIPKNSPPFPQTPAVFRAFNGETNNVTVTSGNGAVFFDSLALLTAGRGCTANGDGSATCPDVRVVEVYLKDEDDTAHVVTSGGNGSVWAGSGNDSVTADSFGQATFVYGQGGNDTISAGGDGGQLADGGSGDDVVHAGGFGGDATGIGGSGDDMVDWRSGLGGFATLDGGNGDDTLVSVPTGGTAAGGAGNDVIVIHGHVPGPLSHGGFTVSGGAGDDTIIAQPHEPFALLADTIDAGDGRDYIDVLDGGADTVTCGPGNDIVRYDETDTIAADCEILLGPDA
jgi:hypothetical protein